MAYENGGCGPHVPAAAGDVYRGLKLNSNAVPVDIVVESAGVQQNLHLEPGEVHSGQLIIVSGTLTGVFGYLP